MYIYIYIYRQHIVYLLEQLNKQLLNLLCFKQHFVSDPDPQLIELNLERCCWVSCFLLQELRREFVVPVDCMTSQACWKNSSGLSVIPPDRQHWSVSPNGRKSWETWTGICWVLGFGGLLPLESLQRRHLLPLQLLLVLPSEAGNLLLLPRSSLSGTTTVRLPIACSITFLGARPSAEPCALLVFSRVPVLLLCKGATSVLLRATGLETRVELQQEDWFEVFWRG